MPFDFDGEKYARASKHQKEWGNSLISTLPLRGDERVLDLGCGDGALSAQIANLVPDGSVLGIDASSGMLRTAKKLESDNLSFEQIDISHIDYKDEFDIIFSNAALHWVLDHEALLKHVYRALKPGGSIHWNFAGSGTCTAFCDVMRALMQDGRYAPNFDGFAWPWFMPSKKRYEALIAPVGFSRAEVTEENRDRSFADIKEMTAWIDQPSIVPFLERIPNEEKEPFRDEVVRRMIAKTCRPDGTCFETFRRIRVTAVK